MLGFSSRCHKRTYIIKDLSRESKLNACDQLNTADASPRNCDNNRSTQNEHQEVSVMINNETTNIPFFTIRREGVICLILVIAILAVYWQVGNHAFVNFDDDKYVTENPNVRTGITLKNVKWVFTSTHAANWHPLTWLSHMLDSQIYGLNPGGHHLTNVILHILNSILLFLIFRRMTGALWKGAFVAALFALHPLHVESVAWVAERKDVLSTFFWMLTMGAYVFYTERPGIKIYFITVLLFALGLMAKPMLVTLPFVLLLLDYWPLGRFKFRQQESTVSNSTKKFSSFNLVWEKTPFFVLAAVSSIVTFFVQQSGGAVRSFDVLPFTVRISNALVSYISYIGNMLWPYHLAVLYPHPNNLAMWKFAGAGLLLILISFAVIRFMRQLPYLIVGWLWYLGTLVPVIGLVQVGSQSMADRYTYIPLIGLFVMIAWGVPDLLERWQHRRAFLAISAGCILSVLTMVTWMQLQYWQNSISLFEHAINVTTDNYVMHSNMGVALVEQGKIDKAIVHYREALRIKPDDVDARYNMANALTRQENFKDAIAAYTEVLKIRPDMPTAHNNMGIALSRLGESKKAVSHFREALRIRPDYRDAEYNLKIALKRGETIKDAVTQRHPLPKQADANNAEAQMRFGVELFQNGDFGGAINHFREVLKTNPEHIEAHINIGLALAYNRQIDAAADHFQKALKINPELAEVHNSLGVALLQKGKVEEADSHFKEALRIKPNFAKAHNSLGVIMARKGRTRDAIFHFREALRIKPDYEEVDRNLKLVLDMQGE